jgi:hypothetical protein
MALAMRHRDEPFAALERGPRLEVRRETRAAAMAALQGRAVDEIERRFASGHHAYVAYWGGLGIVGGADRADRRAAYGVSDPPLRAVPLEFRDAPDAPGPGCLSGGRAPVVIRPARPILEGQPVSTKKPTAAFNGRFGTPGSFDP